MMNKLLSTLLACLFACVSTYAVAAPADAVGTDNPPPAHQQKNQVPDSTGNGNYLQDQPNNNADTNQQNSGNPQAKGAKEKSKRFHQKPEDGGTGTGGSANR